MGQSESKTIITLRTTEDERKAIKSAAFATGESMQKFCYAAVMHFTATINAKAQPRIDIPDPDVYEVNEAMGGSDDVDRS